MNSTRLEISVGAFVLIGLLAVAFLALGVGGNPLTGVKTYTVHARFTNASGVNAGSNISIAGVSIGQVKNVRLNTENFSAIADLEIRNDVRLPNDSIVSVKTSGLIGDKFLSVQPGADADFIAPGGTFTETESTVDLESLISRFAFGSVQNSTTNQTKETKDSP